MAAGFNPVNKDLEEQLQATKETAERCLELVKKQQKQSGSVDIAFNSTVENLVHRLSLLSQLADTGVRISSTLPLGPILVATLHQLGCSLPPRPPPGAEANLLDQLKKEIGDLLSRSDPRNEETIRLKQENAVLAKQLTLCNQEKMRVVEKLQGMQAAQFQNEKDLHSLQLMLRTEEVKTVETEKRAKVLKEKLELALKEKEETEQKDRALIESMRETLEMVRQENDDIKKEAAAQTQSLREKLLEVARQEKETEAQAREQIASTDRQGEADKKAILMELNQSQQGCEEVLQRLSSLLELLEREMQLGEEFRRRLGQYESQKDFQTLTLEALSRIEKRQEEAAAKMADTEFRKQQDSLDEDFMNRLPDDVKVACLRIQRLIGGMGREFGERLLGRHVAWSTEELEGSGLFFTRSKFWLCIRKWVEASSVPSTDAPLTLDHLTSVCNKLRVNPTTLEEIREEQESNLERNFEFLAKHAMVVEVAAFFRNKLKLTEEAWTFLLMPGTSRQKMDRLLAVVYSMGQEGYNLLLEALGSTCQRHVVARLTGGGANVDVLGETMETSTVERGPTADPFPDGSLLTSAAMAAADADRDNTSRKTPVDADTDNASKKIAVDADRDKTSRKTPVDVDGDNASQKPPVDADRDNTSRKTAVDADRDNTFKKSCNDKTPDPPLSKKDEQPATVKAIRNLLEETTVRQTAQIRQLFFEQLGNFKEILTGVIPQTDQTVKLEENGGSEEVSIA